jgi:hypothetical protein
MVTEELSVAKALQVSIHQFEWRGQNHILQRGRISGCEFLYQYAIRAVLLSFNGKMDLP